MRFVSAPPSSADGAIQRHPTREWDRTLRQQVVCHFIWKSKPVAWESLRRPQRKLWKPSARLACSLWSDKKLTLLSVAGANADPAAAARCVFHFCFFDGSSRFMAPKKRRNWRTGHSTFSIFSGEIWKKCLGSLLLCYGIASFNLYSLGRSKKRIREKM